MKTFIILATVSLAMISCSGKSDKSEIKPLQSNITESIYASVKITPEFSYQVQTIRPGIIDSILVKEGDLVEEAQLMFQISTPALEKVQLLDAEMNYEEARSNYLGEHNLIKNIKLELQSAKAQNKLDSTNFKRQERLLSQSIGKQLDFDQAKLKFINSSNQVKLLEQKLVQTKLSLENNYSKAINRINVEKEQLSDYKIFAKMAGKVYAINKEVGDFVGTQEKLAEIGSSSQFKIEMDIDEVDITKINQGDSVLIVLDAYPKEVFVAEVSKIYDKKNDLTQTFKVESVFKQSPPKLYYGLSGEANIIVSTRKNAITIPTEYLMPGNKVLTNDGEVDVEVGIKNLEFVEILSGLDTSTVINKPND